MSLKLFEKNIQSQFGEDGVIEEVFNRIGTSNKICVEFGAWDGIHLSNAWNLWHNKGWDALLIEGDESKFEVLKNNTKDFKNVKPHLAFVMPDGENSIESILKKFNFPTDIDLLSIDIDGDDYYIFESLKSFRPKLILVEYNPTIPSHLDIIQKKGEYFGCSALALLNLAKSMGYKLVHMTDTNMFFVSTETFIKLEIEETDMNKIFPITHLTNVLTGYDGKAMLTQVPVYMNSLNEGQVHSNKKDIFKNKSKSDSYKPIQTISNIDLIPIEIIRKKL